MEAIRVTHQWQRAGVYYVRVQAMVKGFNIPLEGEFDEGDNQETKYVLIMDENFPVAACRIHIVDALTAKIERVCVLEENRKKGVGRYLITRAEQWIRELGGKHIIVTSRDEAVGFYEALGYKPDLEQTDEGGIFKIIYTEKYI